MRLTGKPDDAEFDSCRWDCGLVADKPAWVLDVPSGLITRGMKCDIGRGEPDCGIAEADTDRGVNDAPGRVLCHDPTPTLEANDAAPVIAVADRKEPEVAWRAGGYILNKRSLYPAIQH